MHYSVALHRHGNPTVSIWHMFQVFYGLICTVLARLYAARGLHEAHDRFTLTGQLISLDEYM